MSQLRRPTLPPHQRARCLNAVRQLAFIDLATLGPALTGEDHAFCAKCGTKFIVLGQSDGAGPSFSGPLPPMQSISSNFQERPPVGDLIGSLVGA